MKLAISDEMMVKMNRALRCGGQLYDLHDIGANIANGKMQGHVEGGTWGVTEVHDWPKHRSVNIVFVVGDLEESLRLEEKIIDWAKSIGADHLTAIGRDGWWGCKTEGWKKLGTFYSKEI